MSEKLCVNVLQGTLRGKKVTSEVTGQVYYSFQGIPYAKAPVGPLRFKAPQPPDHWTGIKDAVSEGPVCPQDYMYLGKFMGNENNCLCLNVYTNQWPPADLKPVMVWIHGGAFEVGSGNTDMYGPDYIVNEDVVIVTMNYRLGVLGFLHVDDTDVTPNVGLRDQVAALKWVKENVSKFGGDPNNITIFGESAGGCSVHFLTLTSSSKGLFHRAIPQSGNALLDFCDIHEDDANARAFRLGKFLGLETNDPKCLVDFLRTIEVEKLVMAQINALSEEERQHAITCAFVPSRENFSSSEAFLSAPIKQLVTEGRFQHVPLITGVTSSEGKFSLHSFLCCPTLEEVNEKFDRSLNWNLIKKLGPTKLKTYIDELRNFYFGDSAVDDETIQQYVNMQSDLVFNYPIYAMVKEQVKHSSSPIYHYQFSFKQEMPAFSFPYYNPKAEELPGVTHGAELSLLFHSSIPNMPPPPKTEECDSARRNIVKLFTNFAKTGNPVDDLNVLWPAVKEGYYPFLDISDKLTLHEYLNKERMEFLDELNNTHM